MISPMTLFWWGRMNTPGVDGDSRARRPRMTSLSVQAQSRRFALSFSGIRIVQTDRCFGLTPYEPMAGCTACHPVSLYTGNVRGQFLRYQAIVGGFHSQFADSC